MAIHNQDTIEVGRGVEKRIDMASIGQIMDNLQIYQYQFPEKSTIRELVSNAYDSILEKKQAYEILTGKAKPEDYYIERHEAMYEPSNWNPTYYDLDHLAMTKNKVRIVYEHNDNSSDILTVSDYGVGLGPDRIPGYFKLGWSTKRNSKKLLGKFGLGSKVPLCTLVPFFTTETIYNGLRYRFNIYSHKMDPIIPRWNVITGEENEEVVLMIEDANGDMVPFPVYAERTDEPNQVKVSFETKHRNRQKYLDSINSQLAYFPDVELQLIVNGLKNAPVKVTSSILYEDDNIVISDTPYHSKPHLVLNRVNYGFVQWGELELEDRYGGVGIKLNIDDVTVNPSRESIIWNDVTRDSIQERVKNCFKSANVLTAKMFEGLTFREWAKKASDVRSWHSNSALKVLSEFIKLDTYSMKYTVNDKISLSLSWLLTDRSGLNKVSKIRKSKSTKIAYEHRVNSSEYTLPLYVMGPDEKKNNKRNKYLLTLHPEGFLLLEHEWDKQPWRLSDTSVVSALGVVLPKETYEHYRLLDNREEYIAYYNEWMQAFHDGLRKNSDAVDYGSVVVPDGMTFTDDEEDIDPEEEVTPVKRDEFDGMTFDQIRRKTGRVLVKHIATTPADSGRPYNWVAVLEPTVSFLKTLPAKEVYIGKSDEQELVEFAASLSRVGHREGPTEARSSYQTEDWANDYNAKLGKPLYSPMHPWIEANLKNLAPHPNHLTGNVNGNYRNLIGPTSFFMMNREVRKKFTNYYDIREFFSRIEGKTITMADALIRWNTARKMHDILWKIRYLNNFGQLDADMTNVFRGLVNYCNANYSYNDVPREKAAGLLPFLDKVYVLQRLVHEETNPELIKQGALQLFNAELDSACAVEMNYILKAEKLYADAEPYADLLNHLQMLVGNPKDDEPENLLELAQQQGSMLPDELVTEIRSYIKSKQ